MKVIFENSIFLHQSTGGISKYISKINKIFQKKNINSVIYSPISINNNLDENKNYNIFFLKFKKIPRFCTKLFYLINNLATIFFINFYKPDIIHFTYYNNFLLKFIKIPYIVTVYDLISKKKSHVDKNFNKDQLIKNASHIICISNTTKQQLNKFYKIDKKKISVIYLGVENNKKLITKKKKYILFVGSRTHYKNFLNFIKAYSKSKYLISNFKVYCFGLENFNLEEIQLFENLKIKSNIYFKSGSDKTLNRMYQNASLFVAPSKEEGFGLTPLEAMSCGCPTICSSIPVFREILGNSCGYINPNKITDIKKKMETILKSKKKQKTLIESGFLRAQQYSWEKNSLETIKIYNKVLN
jgi:glycosyltransferase involved in cell wall biosynthesis